MKTTNTAVQLVELENVEAELRAKKASLKAAQKVRDWETATLAKNSQYVVGSRRAATEEDEAALGHTHGQVGTIQCLNCVAERTVNVQDAGQTRYCKACKAEVDKATSRERRIQKRVSGKSVEQLRAEIAEASQALEALNRCD